MALILNIKTTVRIDNADINIVIFLFGIIKIKRYFYFAFEKENIITLYSGGKYKIKPVTSLKKILRQIKQTKLTDRQKLARKKALLYIIKKTHLTLRFYTSLGINNAYRTALICGVMGVISSISSAIINGPKRKITIQIEPQFSKSAFSLQADCIIELSPANIIIGYIINKINKRR